VLAVHHGFTGEPDFIEGALLASFPPLFRNKRRGTEAGRREVIDDLVEDLLGK
jgi:hypothetical protein